MHWIHCVLVTSCGDRALGQHCMVQVMACSLTAPSNYLNQCRFSIIWHTFQDSVYLNTEDFSPRVVYVICTFRITAMSVGINNLISIFYKKNENKILRCKKHTEIYRLGIPLKDSIQLLRPVSLLIRSISILEAMVFLPGGLTSRKFSPCSRDNGICFMSLNWLAVRRIRSRLWRLGVNISPNDTKGAHKLYCYYSITCGSATATP